MHGRYSYLIKFIHFIGDVILLNLAYFIAYYLRFDNWDLITNTDYPIRLMIFNLCWVLIIYIYDIYAIHRTTHFTKVVSNVFNSILTHLLLLLTVYYLVFKFAPSRLQLLYAYSIFSVLVITWRSLVIWNLKLYRRRGGNFKNVVFIGHNTIDSDLFKYMKSDVSLGYRINAFFDDSPDSLLYKTADTNVYKLDQFISYCNENPTDEIFIMLDNIEIPVVNRIIRYAENNMIRVRILPVFTKYIFKKVEIDFYGHVPILNIRREPLESLFNRLQKRLFDVVFSLIMILLVFPIVFALTAILIKLTSKGPIFFSQERTGKGDKVFKCYKFRTMEVNEMADELQATPDDPRITKIGRVLRKYNLDELPQFFNVLFGHMSVIGPRPHMLKHTEQYSSLIDKFMVRHFIKPGISGWAQVNGFRGETKNVEQMEERVRADIWYIENWSVMLDIKIVVLTLLNAIKGDKNAY